MVTIVFIVVAAAYAAPPKITATAPDATVNIASATAAAANGYSNRHNTFGDVYDTAANFFKRLLSSNK